jgi:Icc protein
MFAPNHAAASPPLRVLQLTDTHLYADHQGCLLGLNTQGSFAQILTLLQQCHWPADLLLATGDLVHDGSAAGYQRLHAQMAELDVPVYCIPGNHDEAQILKRSLNGDKVLYAGSADYAPWAFVFLDSTKPGSEAGLLDDRQLAHLQHSLETFRERHVLICLHHQPVPVGSRWLDTMLLENADDFFAIVDRAPQVRGITWGHVHQHFDSLRNGVRLLACPSTCIQFKPGQETFGLDTLAPGYRWLNLHPDGRIETGIQRLAAYPQEMALDRRAHGY